MKAEPVLVVFTSHNSKIGLLQIDAFKKVGMHLSTTCGSTRTYLLQIQNDGLRNEKQPDSYLLGVWKRPVLPENSYSQSVLSIYRGLGDSYLDIIRTGFRGPGCVGTLQRIFSSCPVPWGFCPWSRGFKREIFHGGPQTAQKKRGELW